MPVILALWEVEEGGLPEVRSLRPIWPTWKNPVSTKNTKISQAWWQVPVIPATQEAEAGELPEPRRQRLQWAEITPLDSSLVDKSETLSQKQQNSSLKCRLINHNQMCHSVGSIDNKGSCACVVEGNIWKISVPLTWFCHEQIVLKKPIKN